MVFSTFLSCPLPFMNPLGSGVVRHFWGALRPPVAGQASLGHREPPQTLTLLSPPIHCRDFLPRGSGIVTRRPLVLQLVNATTGMGFPSLDLIPHLNSRDKNA